MVDVKRLFQGFHSIKSIVGHFCIAVLFTLFPKMVLKSEEEQKYTIVIRE